MEYNVSNISDDVDMAKWAKFLFRDIIASLAPVFGVTLGLPALGSWILFVNISPSSLRESLCLGWVLVLITVVVVSSLRLPADAVRYRSFLSRRGKEVRVSALIVSALYSVTFGVFFAAVLRRFQQVEAPLLLPFIGYFTYCLLV